MDDMGRLVFLEELPGLFWIPERVNIISILLLPQQSKACAHLRSPSDEEAKTHVSPGFLPNREPWGSVSITCWIAFPTRPVPPVTKMTDIVDEGTER